MTSKLETILSRDARVDTNYAGNPTYVVHKSGITYTGYKYSTQSATMSSIQFICNPSSSNVFVSRKVLFTLPLRITIKVPATPDIPANNILQEDSFGFRFMPISNAISSLQATVNGQNTSILLSDVIQPLMSFNTAKLKQDYLTMTPNTFDLSQSYFSLKGTVRSNLASIGDNLHSAECQRGAFPMNIVRNDVMSENVDTYAIIDVVLTEPLFISPFRCDVDDTCGFYNVTTMNLNINFVGSSLLASKIFSYCPSYNVANPFIPDNQNITIELGSSVPMFSFSSNKSPELQFDYISPSQFQIIPPILNYDYYDVQRHLSSTVDVAPATISTYMGVGNVVQQYINPSVCQFIGPNIQVASVPSYIVLYVRRTDDNKKPYTPDTYLPIRSISLQVGNNTTLLASCTKRQLYKIAKENGCEFTWAEWSGEPCVEDTILTATGRNYVCGQGSILKLRFGKDIQLDNESLASGSNALLMIQATVNCENWQPLLTYNGGANNIPETQNYSAQLYMLVVSEGIFAITGSNSASSALGVLQQSNVIDTITQSNVYEYDVVDKEGGSFASTLKKGWQKAIPYIKKYGPEVAKGALKGAVEALGVVGLGGELMTNDNNRQNYHSNFLSGGVSAGMNAGGVSAGGQMLPRKELKKRLAKGY